MQYSDQITDLNQLKQGMDGLTSGIAQSIQDGAKRVQDGATNLRDRYNTYTDTDLNLTDIKMNARASSVQLMSVQMKSDNVFNCGHWT